MQSTKCTKEEHLVSAIKSCLIQRRRKPNIVKVLTLDKAFKVLPVSLLAREIAFALSRDFKDRLLEDRYMFAYNSTILPSWDTIAVVNKPKHIKKFSDVICIDYSTVYQTENKLFKDILLQELNQLRRI